MTTRKGKDPESVGESIEATLARIREAQVKSSAARAPALRKAPPGDEQLDLFVPLLYDVGTKDSRSIMDVAPFRLSKSNKRAGEILRYELTDGYVEVKAGPDGMASVWDYDIILMCISILTEAANRWKAGKGEKPGNILRPQASEILKFCRKGDGGNQGKHIEAALDRLKNTTIKIVRQRTGSGGKTIREVEAEGLINKYKVLSFTDKGNIASVEIEVPTWVYREVVEATKPGVLTVHPDYFLLDSGLARFLYRIARKSAGRTSARWLFSTLHERSGSTGTLYKFMFTLRALIKQDILPEYTLSEIESQDGKPMLSVIYRGACS